jgi:hypothetical protein
MCLPLSFFFSMTTMAQVVCALYEEGDHQHDSKAGSIFTKDASSLISSRTVHAGSRKMTS